MTAVWTLAGLTIKEAMRRRLFVAGLLIALLLAGLAFIHIPLGRPSILAPDPDSQRNLLSQTLGWMGCGMIKFFSSILAVTLAAGAITAEVEKGVLSTIVPKPLPRASIYLGKWLGLILLLAACLVVWGLLLAWAVWMQTHLFHPRLFLGILATGLFPLLFTTLTLFFSSFATFALSAGLALIAAGLSLAEDTLLLFARIFSADSLKTLASIVGYIVPLGRMNHWITRGLGNAGFDWSALSARGPGESAVATGAGDMTYIICYILAFLAAGLYVFQKRDL
jgi:Cu-processing system permease protein